MGLAADFSLVSERVVVWQSWAIMVACVSLQIQRDFHVVFSFISYFWKSFYLDEDLPYDLLEVSLEKNVKRN